MKRRNSFEMLRDLPGVFSLRDVVIRHGLSEAAARQYCWRWGNAGMVTPVGPRIGVFYNLVVEPNKEYLLAAALEKALGIRPYVIVGHSALNDAGWTTQMPQRIELALLVTRETHSYPMIDGVDILPRPLAWFQAMKPGIAGQLHGIAILPPEHALVDTLRTRLLHGNEPNRGWRPGADDIDPFDINANESLVRMREIAAAIKVPEKILLDYLSRIECFEEALNDSATMSTNM